MPLIAQACGRFVKADAIMTRYPRRTVKAPRIMSKYYHAILDRLIARGFAAPRAPVRLGKAAKMLILAKYAFILKVRIHLMTKTVHIIGAGIWLCGVRSCECGYAVHVHEATQLLGGRCRSYF